jgi:penicillin-binding protein 1A
VRVDRGSGKRVYGVFPIREDPKSSVIWEAFQPQTEPRRTYRSALGDPYNTQQQQAQWQAMLRQRQLALQQRAAAQSGRPAPTQRPPAVRPPLPTQNSL